MTWTTQGLWWWATSSVAACCFMHALPNSRSTRTLLGGALRRRPSSRRLAWFVRLHVAMPRHLATVASVLVMVFALAIVFWLVRILFAPHVFFFLSSHFLPGLHSPLALVVLAAIAPVLVAIPFGCGFGFLPWRRPMALALLVGVLALGLNVAHTV